MLTRQDIESTTLKALRYLAGFDADGARERNNVGFSGAHSDFGRSMAGQSYLSDKQMIHAVKMVNHYKNTQLAGWDLPTLEDWQSLKLGKGLSIDLKVSYLVSGDKVGLWTNRFDSDFVVKCKGIDGHWYESEWNGQQHVRTFPLASIPALNSTFKLDIPVDENARIYAKIELVDAELLVTLHGVDYSAKFVRLTKEIDGRDYKKSYKGRKHVCVYPLEALEDIRERFPNGDYDEGIEDKIEVLTGNEGEIRRLSSALDTGFNHSNLDDRLFPYQRAGVEFYEMLDGNLLNADPMGLGKTNCTISYLAMHPELRRALFVVPSNVKYNWVKEFEMWGAHEETFCIIEGVAPRTVSDANEKLSKVKKGGKAARKAEEALNKWLPVVDQTIEEIQKATVVILNWEILSAWVDVLSLFEWEYICFDEIQRAKAGQKSQRGAAALDIARKTDRVTGLTGTPLMNRPRELWEVMNIIKPGYFVDFFSFAKRHCNAYRGRYGWNFDGASNLEELHHKLQPIMLRRDKVKALPQLPGHRRQLLPIKLSDEDMNKYYDMVEEAQMQAGSHAGAAVLGLIEKCKQFVVECKMKAVIDYCEQFQDAEEKLILFFTHAEPVRVLSEKFADCSVQITGKQNAKQKQEAKERFQGDPDCLFAFCNVLAAGEGITLTASSASLFVEFGWTPTAHSQAEARAWRTGQQRGVVSTYLYVPDTIEAHIVELLDTKADVFARAIDGESSGQFTPEEIEADFQKSIIEVFLTPLERK